MSRATAAARGVVLAEQRCAKCLKSEGFKRKWKHLLLALGELVVIVVVVEHVVVVVEHVVVVVEHVVVVVEHVVVVVVEYVVANPNNECLYILGEHTYLTLAPGSDALTEGHCRIVPLQHAPGLTSTDESTIREFSQFKRLVE